MCARRIGNGVEDVYATAAEWVDRALAHDDSLFTPGNAIWTAEVLGELRRRFLDQPDVSGDDFYLKLQRQLAGSSPQTYQLMAEVLFVHFLIIWEPSMRSETKRDRVERVLGWGAEVKNISGALANAWAPGFVNLGAGRSRSLPFMVGFIINFVEQWKGLEPGKRQGLLKDPWTFKDFVGQVDLQGRLYLESPARHRSQMDALFYLVHPDDFEPITSQDRKVQISNAFAHLVNEPIDDIDRTLRQIRSGLEAAQGKVDFFDPPIRAQWDDRYKPDLWVDFINRARRYITSDRLGRDETDYKIGIARRLAAAREAVFNGNDDWSNSMRNGLFASHNNLIHFIVLSKIHGWFGDHADDALAALQEVWAGDESTVTDRIRNFCGLLPRSVVSGSGTRANVVSVLLMGLDAERYPPFRTRAFEKAYDLTGYGRPQSGSDEAALYGYALDFLDRFIDEASANGLEIPHRLDAQGIVWGILTYGDEMPEEDEESDDDPETVIDFATLAKGLYLPAGFLEEIDTLLEDKKQVIFQGPPGTGKTYVAQKLAAHLAGSPDRVDLVQLHPSYAYEDFVQGFRPTLNAGQPGFTLADGPLLRAAKRARAEPNARHFLVIDEINRGNVAKVFGELYFLLEYRNERIRLQYQDESDGPFTLPENLYFIGTMNTADRSIALVDLALRRRFYFVDFHPDEEPVRSVLRGWIRVHAPEMEWVADVVDATNERLQDDRHAAIGPSYFMKAGLNDEMVRRVWRHSVQPYIEERFFGHDDRLNEFDLDKLWQTSRPDRVPESVAGSIDLRQDSVP